MSDVYTAHVAPRDAQTPKLILRSTSTGICVVLIGLGAKLASLPGLIIAIMVPVSALDAPFNIQPS